jgi:hypothetical protein
VCGSAASLRAVIAGRIPETEKMGARSSEIRNRDRWAYRYGAAQRVAADRAPDSQQARARYVTAVKPAGRKFLMQRFESAAPASQSVSNA